jgi:hypothetical protein
MMRSVAIAAVALLAGCAGTPNSYMASPLSNEAGAVVALDIIGFVSTETTPAHGPIVVQRAAGDTVVGPVLIQDLQQAGFTIADKGRHRLVYEITQLPDGTVLRVTFDHASAARLYHRLGDQLEPSGPFSIRGGRA